MSDKSFSSSFAKTAVGTETTVAAMAITIEQSLRVATIATARLGIKGSATTASPKGRVVHRRSCTNAPGPQEEMAPSVAASDRRGVEKPSHAAAGPSRTGADHQAEFLSDLLSRFTHSAWHGSPSRGVSHPRLSLRELRRSRGQVVVHAADATIPTFRATQSACP